MTSQLKLSITGGRVIDPFTSRDEIIDIHIAEGRIVGVHTPPPGFQPDRIIDARNLIVSPGFIDLSARLGEPGFAQKGTIHSETAAAAKGGVTFLCCPPDSRPVVDSPAVVKLICDRSHQAGFCQVNPIAALTQGLEGEQLSAMAALQEAGCVAVSNSWLPIKNNQILRRCMEYAATFGLSLFVNAQDASLAAGGCAHEGLVATRLGLPAIPESAETIAIMTHLLLAEQTGVRLHFSQISAGKSAQLIAQAQRQGLAVSADVAIHQLLLSEQNIDHYNALSHCQPPLRSLRDQDELRQALADGTVQALCSDHRPHEHAAKSEPFAETAPGISSLETLLPLTLKLVECGVLSLNTALQRLTQGPAQVLGLPCAGISVGATADLTVFSPTESWEINADTLISAGKNTPFLGETVAGKVKLTLLMGRVVYED